MRYQYHHFIILLVALCLVPSVGLPTTPIPDEQTQDKTLVIGVLINRSKARVIKKWQPLADYLSENIEGHQFVLKVGDLKSMYQWGQQQAFDYLLSNPKMYVEFEYNYGFRAIATMRNLRLGQAYDAFGSVLLTRKDSPINAINNLHNKTIGIVSKRAWGGWALNWNLLLQNNIDPFQNMRKVVELNTHDNVVQAVLAKKVDVGSVRTDTLERMNQEGLIKLDDIKLVHQNLEYGKKFQFLLSTKLYPEWPFAASNNTQELINKQIAVLLLSLTDKDPPSIAAKNAGWTIPASYQGVHNVLRSLNLPPYENYGKITLTDVIKKYWIIIAISLTLATILIISSFRFYRINNQLATINTKLFDAQAQLAQAEKMANLGNMMSSISQEIYAPLALAKTNTHQLQQVISTLPQTVIPKMQTDLTNLDRDLQQAMQLLTSLESYSRSDQDKIEPLNLEQIIENTLLMANTRIKAVATVYKDYHEIPAIAANTAQMNQIVLNILINSATAIEEKRAALSSEQLNKFSGAVVIKTWFEEQNQQVYLQIADNGIGIQPLHIKHIFKPTYQAWQHTKSLGMGLSLSQEIVEKYDGTITVESTPNEGTEFTLQFPIAPAI